MEGDQTGNWERERGYDSHPARQGENQKAGMKVGMERRGLY